ncbi:MAG: hypothetical protein HN496_05785 [Flavobacteriaceae bacterium]|jgi:FMN phosphatase YigB (HAD superfamily)|nr:hypothetical protein [Flavobacteriaceae bacterium]
MIHYVFDLDDTLIIHQKGIKINYNMIQKNNSLKNLLENCKGECYIYTNGTFGHAYAVIGKMDIKKYFFKIYSRDTLPYMKPDKKSFLSVNNDIQNIYSVNDKIYFFDDLLENLKTAKSLGWITFWIHPDFLTGHQYEYIDYAFKDIQICLKYLEKQYINNNIF